MRCIIFYVILCSYYGNNGAYGYDGNGGYDANYGQYPQQQPSMMTPGGSQPYSGQIMQPQAPAAGGISDTYTNGFDDEPPLLEELGTSFILHGNILQHCSYCRV